jgi:hypothetical protein
MCENYLLFKRIKRLPKPCQTPWEAVEECGLFFLKKQECGRMARIIIVAQK